MFQQQKNLFQNLTMKTQIVFPFSSNAVKYYFIFPKKTTRVFHTFLFSKIWQQFEAFNSTKKPLVCEWVFLLNNFIYIKM